ncbi:MAG: hypothetical protein HFI33_04750 [Lachnospiraceae bacterium]|nr:hypothetical protein [Lachnospiraceae bacterium]
MSEFDWNNLGSNIRDVVQDAIETKDFERLNSNLSQTIEQAMEGVGVGMRQVGQAAGRAVDEAARNLRQQVTFKNGVRWEPEPYVGPRKSSDRHPKPQWPVLFANVSGRRVGGILLTVFGSIFSGVLLLLLLVMTLVGLANFWPGSSILLCGIFLGLLLAGSVFMAVKGGSMRAEANRFQSYVEILGGRTFCDLKELGTRMGRDLKYIRKDIQRMMRKQWFLQGHLDRQGTCLIVSNETYGQYLQAESQRELRMAQERKEAQERESVPAQVQEVLEAGEAYIRRIQKCNNDIPGEEISAKITRIEKLVRQIFVRVEQYPEMVPDIRKLMEYYLPTTVKLLDAYAQLDAQPVQGEHIASSKKEIEDALDTLNVAFEKLLDSLFRDTAWDVSADISVLETMLAQEGLTEQDFRRDTQ